MRILLPLDMTFTDYPDTVSMAVLVFFSGCDNNCSGCQNPLLKNYKYNRSVEVTPLELYYLIKSMANKLRTNKVVFSGGDPLFSLNIDGVNSFLKIYNKEFDVCVYTGKNINFVKENVEPCFTFIKVNKFENEAKRESKKTDECFQLSSPNQEIYDKNFNCLTEDGKLYFKNEE